MIREKVNVAVGDLFKAYKANFIPSWPLEFDAALQKVALPAIPAGESKEIGVDVLRDLYALGLIGVCVESSVPASFTQRFLGQWDRRYSSSFLQLPRSDYYFLHPWLFDAAKSCGTPFIVDKRNIIGDGCLFRKRAAVKVQLKRDANGHPALWINGKLDGTGRSGQMMNISVVFILIMVFAVRSKDSTRVSRNTFSQMKTAFTERFPMLKHKASFDPYQNGEHRSHLRSELFKNFPDLADHLIGFGEPFTFHGSKGESLDAIDVNFLHLDDLQIEI